MTDSSPGELPKQPIDRLQERLRDVGPTTRRGSNFGRGPAPATGRLAALRRDDAILSLATAHATKGLEFDHVVVIGLEEGRFPSARSVQDAADPARALEEERRLAYVAWTRARRTLTLLYDPLVPSPFLLEAFSPGELRLPLAI